MISHRDFLLAYDITLLYGTKVEFTLVHISSLLLEFLDEHPLFVTTDGVFVKYIGSRLVLEPRDPPSGRPEGIILPRLLVEPPSLERKSESPRVTVGLLPRPDLIKDRKVKIISASERTRGTLNPNRLIKVSDSIHLRDGVEASEYISGICRAMLDLTQGFLDTLDKRNKVITLLINMED